MSTSLFSQMIPEIDANPEQKRLNLYTRALLLLRRPPCWIKHRVTHDARDTWCMSCRDVSQQVKFGLVVQPEHLTCVSSAFRTIYGGDTAVLSEPTMPLVSAHTWTRRISSGLGRNTRQRSQWTSGWTPSNSWFRCQQRRLATDDRNDDGVTDSDDNRGNNEHC